ncbi:Phosphate starvation-inducible protein PhoH predicted ATPase [Rubrobacter radiotolerans]|uniref:PhoH-like protein n=2 Tax=Rubrobacter radiotolerans TaxID=42256 RepID=A0A023X3M4_RUBRA|nr:PhoH family protein [Rubrobacter radiotolerans]AHY46801.1 Phosphate starvation-inducible protein PhoH predicted ATPase [Rubrobacter radiotolerans]SMC05472.1 phosphate starvation-inducible protein PhoH [Rubrobacter radiotolerans DSM 5868]
MVPVVQRLRGGEGDVSRTDRVESKVIIPPAKMFEVFGERDSVLRRVEELVECEVVVRGNEVVLSGEELAVERAEAVFEGLLELVEGGHHPDRETAERLYRMSEGGGAAGEKGGHEVLSDVILTYRGRRVAPKTRNQKRYTDAIRKSQVTFGVGPAGTGKTYLAVALAVDALNRGEVNRIILTRPAVEAGESLGFLPGDMMAKVDPYFRPLYDALYEMIDPAKFQSHLERGVVEIAPLAFMRGRTLNDAFIILDEAQNTTPQQMKMFLTRLGFGSRMVITGDLTQVDLPSGKNSGLSDARKILGDVEGVAFVGLRRDDIVRSDLVMRIVDAYEGAETESGPEGAEKKDR